MYRVVNIVTKEEIAKFIISNLSFFNNVLKDVYFRYAKKQVGRSSILTQFPICLNKQSMNWLICLTSEMLQNSVKKATFNNCVIIVYLPSLLHVWTNNQLTD